MESENIRFNFEVDECDLLIATVPYVEPFNNSIFDISVYECSYSKGFLTLTASCCGEIPDLMRSQIGTVQFACRSNPDTHQIAMEIPNSWPDGKSTPRPFTASGIMNMSKINDWLEFWMQIDTCRFPLEVLVSQK